jgi:N-acetyl-gamma-glutamylphosphate reductase
VVADNLRKGAALNAVQVAEGAIELGVLGGERTLVESRER